MVLKFNKDGLLPPGDHEMKLSDLKESLLVVGNGSSSSWDRDWRYHLVEQLGIMTSQLAQIGIYEVYVNGSFVEDKDHPNDIDGFFFCEPEFAYSGELARKLNLLDPYKIWTWAPESRRHYRGYAKAQLPMWLKYRVELYPDTGLPCGISDAKGQSLRFREAFRQSRFENKNKGIIKLITSKGE